jgi:cold shock CspA family protein
MSNNTNTLPIGSTHIGRVKWFNSQRGFGFICTVGSEVEHDLFVHHTEIKTKVDEDFWTALYEGEYVSFTVGVDQKNNCHAKDVTGVMGGPLLCEVNHGRQRSRENRRGSGPNNRRNSRSKREIRVKNTDNVSQTETSVVPSDSVPQATTEQ